VDSEGGASRLLTASELLGPASARTCLLAGLAVGLVLFGYGAWKGTVRHRANPLPWGADAGAYCRMAEAIVERHSFELPPPDRIGYDPQVHVDVPWGTPYALTVDGRVFPKHPLLFGLLLAPGYALGWTLGAFLVSLFLSATLVGLVTARAASAFGVLPAACAALVFAFDVPPVRTVLFAISLDVALALGMVAALALAAGGKPFAAAFVAGLTLFLRPTAPLLVAPAVLSVALSDVPRRWLRAALGLAVPLGVFLATNQVLWGSPLGSSYQRALILTRRGWALGTHTGEFGGAIAHGLATLFLHPASGLLVAAPVLLLGCLGYARREARRVEWLGASVVSFLAVVVLAKYTFLDVVPAYNGRFALPFLVSCVPPLAAALGWVLSQALARIRIR
jgi:hypothetical protein